MSSFSGYPEDSLPEGMEVVRKSIKYCRKMGYVVNERVRIDRFNTVLDMFRRQEEEMTE